MRRTAFLVAFSLVVFSISPVGCQAQENAVQAEVDRGDGFVRELPDISTFQAHPSDRFLVDLDDFTTGHPFKGVNSLQPHAGAHITFDNSGDRWSKGGKEPANCPAIYAVADGILHFPEELCVYVASWTRR